MKVRGNFVSCGLRNFFSIFFLLSAFFGEAKGSKKPDITDIDLVEDSMS